MEWSTSSPSLKRQGCWGGASMEWTWARGFLRKDRPRSESVQDSDSGGLNSIIFYNHPINPVFCCHCYHNWRPKMQWEENQQLADEINRRPCCFMCSSVLDILACSIACNREKSGIIQVSIDRYMVGKMLEYHTDIVMKRDGHYKLTWKDDQEIWSQESEL